MSTINTNLNRRSFLKTSAAAGGGLVLGFNWSSCSSPEEIVVMPSEWSDINGFLKIAENGLVTIMSPNPEVGQNVKTSMPMIVAEELDVAWKNVIVEQAPLDSENFTRQVAGGSQSIRRSWTALRTAGATGRKMLVNAAAKKWDVDPSTLTVKEGVITDQNGNSIGYGEIATEAGTLKVPNNVELKDPSQFTIIGKETPNVDLDKIIRGEPLFGLDTKVEGMLYVCVLRPPAFGQSLVSYDDSAAKNVAGVSDVVRFGDKIAVLATSTWAAMQGQQALLAKWQNEEVLENTLDHNETMLNLLNQPASEPRRKDGNVVKAFAEADEIIERTYEAPFLPHNCMEPMNFFANVTDEKVEMIGPIQTPERTRTQIARLLERKESEVTIDMTRMGGGFGRRLYGDFALEAAEISNLTRKPVQVIYSREDDMTAGIYRPASKYKFKAGIKDGKMTAYHLVGVGVNMGNSTRQDNFPAGAVENYLVESHRLDSKITTGAWRAPITNFLAYAEQSFLDEVAVAISQDPVEFRLALFAQAKGNPTGEINYDINKFVGVIKLAAEKANWGSAEEGTHQGFSAYYSHNTYVAEVADVIVEDGTPRVKKVTCAADCGIVINPLGAKNQVEGGVVDGIGHAMFGNLTFDEGRPQQRNFDKYRMIRMPDAPVVECHFVESTNDPTGLGEPALPPAGGAVANAIHSATGQRLYKQPFVEQTNLLG